MSINADSAVKRVSGAMLDSHVGQRVSLVGRVLDSNADRLILEAAVRGVA